MRSPLDLPQGTSVEDAASFLDEQHGLPTVGALRALRRASGGPHEAPLNALGRRLLRSLRLRRSEPFLTKLKDAIVAECDRTPYAARYNAAAPAAAPAAAAPRPTGDLRGSVWDNTREAGREALAAAEAAAVRRAIARDAERPAREPAVPAADGAETPASTATERRHHRHHRHHQHRRHRKHRDGAETPADAEAGRGPVAASSSASSSGARLSPFLSLPRGKSLKGVRRYSSEEFV